MKKIFIIHSNHNRDTELCAEFLKHLGNYDVFHNERIKAGDEVWEEKKSLVHSSDIILLLLSADFIQDDKCIELLTLATSNYLDQSEKKIIPILTRYCLWEGVLGANCHKLKNNVIPKQQKFIDSSNWDNISHAFYDVAKSLERMLNPSPNKFGFVGKDIHITCDRSDQERDFNIAFQSHLENKIKIQYYLMNAEDADSPDSLVKRFSQEIIRTATPNGNIAYKRIPLKIGVKEQENFRYELWKSFGVSSKFTKNLDAQVVVDDAARKGIEAFIVSHQLTVLEWNTEAEKFIKWLVRDFWNSYQIDAQSPQVILFVNLKFEKIKLSGLAGMFGWGKQPKVEGYYKTAKALFEQHASDVVYLPEMNEVTRDQVIDWAKNNHLYDNMMQMIDDICDKIFGEDGNKKVKMKEVLKNLTGITKLNNQHIITS